MMRLLILLLQAMFACGASAPGVQSVCINSDWTFNYFPSGDDGALACAVDYDDSAWKAVALPHTWVTYETTGDLHPFIRSASEREDSYWWNGFGWYRKRVTFKKSLAGKKIFVEFDAVQKYSRLYVNGEYVGEHKGGYTSFSFDITDYVNFGQENVLAVQVSSRRDDKFGTIPPATAGNFNVYGGIYRDVRIVVKNPLYIPFQGSAEHEGGTFITTPHVSDNEADFRLSAFVRNGTAGPQHVTVRSVASDADGRVVCSLYSSVGIAAGETAEVVQNSGPLKGVHLWSPESPYLYDVRTEVYGQDGALSDIWHTPLGFRYFHWDYDAGTLVLNGKRIHIHGTNRHQEYPWLGDAEPKWMTEKDMMDIRYGMNTNFMRTAHYPQDPMVYDFNDRHGIITVEEVPNDKNIEFDRKVQEQNMREMVRRDRNHPSILFWSVGNETSMAADSRWTHEEDSTRIIHERKTERYGDYVTHHASDLDMENLLRVTVRGWTDNDVKPLEPKNESPDSKSGQQAGNEEWQHSMARVRDGSIRGRIDGQIVCWLYADHGCDRIYKDAPLKNINYKGWVDLFRVPKYMYYLWQANYLEEPMVFVHPHNWQRKYLGKACSFRVDSNCDSVELFVNGRSCGVRTPDASNFHTVEFEDIPVEAGVIRAVARRGEEVVENEVVMAGEPARIVLEASPSRIPADRSGISVITARVVDVDGNPVQGFSAPLHWEVKGEGSLVGPPDYVSDMDKTLDTDGSGYVTAPVPNLVRSTAKPGRINITVSSPGLTPGRIGISSFKVRAGSREIVLPVLSDKGRVPVARDGSFRETVVYAEEMGRLFAPARIEASGAEEYREAIKTFILSRNPAIDKRYPEFRHLLRRMAAYIENTRGELTEDDYNFMARAYNDARYLSDKIRSRNFHPAYAEALINECSQQLIGKGRVLDIAQCAEFIDAMPGGLDVVYVRRPAAEGVAPFLKYGNTTYYYTAVAADAEELICLFHPEFSGFDAERKDRVFRAIAEMNPYFHRSGTAEAEFDYDAAIAIPRDIDSL